MEKRSIPNELLLPAVAEMLAGGHDIELMTKGSSMLPFIRGDRDSVVLRRSDPKPGDIALARIAEGHYVLHRIIAVEGGRVTLMGDGNLAGTESCGVEDIAGTVIDILKPRRDGSLRSVKPTSGRIWKALKPLRRYILYIYRHLLKWTEGASKSA